MKVSELKKALRRFDDNEHFVIDVHVDTQRGLYGAAQIVSGNDGMLSSAYGSCTLRITLPSDMYIVKRKKRRQD